MATITDSMDRVSGVKHAIGGDSMLADPNLAQHLMELCDAVNDALAQVREDLHDLREELWCDCPACLRKRRP